LFGPTFREKGRRAGRRRAAKAHRVVRPRRKGQDRPILCLSSRLFVEPHAVVQLEGRYDFNYAGAPPEVLVLTLYNCNDFNNAVDNKAVVGLVPVYSWAGRNGVAPNVTPLAACAFVSNGLPGEPYKGDEAAADEHFEREMAVVAGIAVVNGFYIAVGLDKGLPVEGGGGGHKFAPAVEFVNIVNALAGDEEEEWEEEEEEEEDDHEPTTQFDNGEHPDHVDWAL
jgi:hypothetical protein